LKVELPAVSLGGRAHGAEGEDGKQQADEDAGRHADLLRDGWTAAPDATSARSACGERSVM
jgi:hypothetical protein